MNRSGYLTQTSKELNESLGNGPDFPETNINTANKIEVIKDPTASIENRSFVKDPALQQLAISTSSYPQSTSQLLAYLQGHSITCIYFSNMNVNEGVRTNQADSVYLKNVIHSSWLRIDKFEINVSEAFTYDGDGEKATSEITITGRTYPGVVVPKAGDYLVASIGDDKEGLFVVTKSDASSWRDGRVYLISAYMTSTLTKEEWDVLNAGVIQHVTFSKTNYANGTQALLTSTAYQAQQDLLRMRKVLSSRYFKLFYDVNYDTLMRPDGIYDPYVVRFVNDQTDISITKYRSRQLLYSVEDSYHRTLFARLEDNDSLDVSDLFSRAVLATRVNVVTDAYITPLTGKDYLSVNYNPNDPDLGGVPYNLRFPYICSNGFYTGVIAEMSEWEIFLYTAITTNQVKDYRILYDIYVKNWHSLTPMEMFYRIPIYIWLIDLCVASITNKLT